MATPGTAPQDTGRSHPTSPDLLGALDLIKNSSEYADKRIETLFSLYKSRISIGPYRPSGHRTYGDGTFYPYFTLLSLIVDKHAFRKQDADLSASIFATRDILINRVQSFLALPYEHKSTKLGKLDFYVDLTDSVLDGTLAIPSPSTLPGSEPLATDTMLLIPLMVMITHHGLAGANSARSPLNAKTGPEKELNFWAASYPGTTTVGLGELLPTIGSVVAAQMYMGHTMPLFQYPPNLDKPFHHPNLTYRRWDEEVEKWLRPDRAYPEYRVKLLVLLFEECYLLQDELATIQITAADEASGYMERGEYRDAEEVVRRHIASYIGGRCREVLDRTEFFLHAIYYIHKARAPSVDVGIYRHLYGIVPQSQTLPFES